MADRRPGRIPEWEWLTLIDADGPFLSRAALKSFYPNGLPKQHASVDDVNATFVEEFVRWSSAWSATDQTYAAARDRWVEVVLHKLLDWSDDLRLAPAALRATSPNGNVVVEPYAALEGDSDAPAALVTLVDRTENLRAVGSDGWAANAIDRMAVLLRETGVTIGIVTDGRWWALVSAVKDVATASGVWDALLWREEAASRDAFLALASFASVAGGQPELRLPRLFAESVTSAEQITEALGDQVRRAVELVLQSMSDTHLRALGAGDDSPLPEDAREVYEAAVTVLMRLVFLLFAEERGLLPAHELYRSSYAISGVREQLLLEATATSPEALDHSWESWHRLLAASNALYGGASFEDMRMPAYGGSLFDPDRFPWLQATDAQGSLQVQLSDRTMLAVLRAVQTIEDRALQLSFRDLDVEQIGYVYEGLLGYSAMYVDDVVVGLQGKAGFEPEIRLVELEEIAYGAATPRAFADLLVAHLEQAQEYAKPRTAAQIAKAFGVVDEDVAADALTRLRHALLGDDELAARLAPFYGLIRDDLRGFPYVVPSGGLVMTESPQRANTGTHYTPRSLAEEVVLHALEPLVYSPGPLDTEERQQWRLKSSAEILDLKVADIAAGSGAFLVAAARYLGDRVIEAREAEGVPIGGEDPKRFAIREIVARCLYGADINGMAVEMCKLSLWLISMDPGKPFSFVDDRVFHGNSLLGVTTEAQLKAQHIYPKQAVQQKLAAFDVDEDLENAARLRRELASGQVDDVDRMRSTRAKRALLAQSRKVTARLRDVADGIIAAGLLEGGKPGRLLEERYDQLAEALRQSYRADGSVVDREPLDAIINIGLARPAGTGEVRWKPLHWVLEAPEAIYDRGGFDAVIGNPAFYHSKKITTSFGKNYRDALKSILARGVPGDADLAAYFLLRQAALVRPGGCIGLVVTKSIVQSHTKKVGLDQVVDAGGRLLGLSDPFDWGPRGANVSVVKIWLTMSHSTATGPVLAKEPLQPKGVLPVRSYVGTYPNGDGLRVPASLAAGWIADDASLGSRLRPYVRAGDLSQGDPTNPDEYLIDLDGLTEREARRYSVLWTHLERYQRPWRSRPTVKPRLQKYWWHFESGASTLYGELSTSAIAIAIPRTSNLLMPLWVDPQMKYDMGVVVFPCGDLSTYAQLASSLHYHWALNYAATTRDDPSYAPRRVSNTFPWVCLRGALAASKTFSTRLTESCVREGGLRPVMNSMHDAEFRGGRIDELRELFIGLDREVLAGFGWTDLQPTYDFRVFRNLTRFTVDTETRSEILLRLIEENHRRASTEAHQAQKPTGCAMRLDESHAPEGAMFQ